MNPLLELILLTAIYTLKKSYFVLQKKPQDGAVRCGEMYCYYFFLISFLHKIIIKTLFFGKLTQNHCFGQITYLASLLVDLICVFSFSILIKSLAFEEP